MRYMLTAACFSVFLLLGVTGAEQVTVNIAGKPVRAEVLSVTDKLISLKIDGREQSLPSSLLDSDSLYLCRKAKSDPQSARDHFELGKFCLSKKLADAAEKEFDAAQRLKPDEFSSQIAAVRAAANPQPVEQKTVPVPEPAKPDPALVPAPVLAPVESADEFTKKYKDAPTGLIEGQIDGTTVSPHPEWSPKFDDKVALKYTLFVPELKVGERLPLLVSLHGAGDTQAPYMKMWKGHGEKNRWMILTPKSNGPSWSPYCMVRIGQLVGELKAKYPVDAARIYIHGYSNGGNTAALIASVNPGLFAAMACFHGFPSKAIAARQEGQNLKRTRVFACAGGKDPFFPLERVKETCAALKDIGVSVQLHERPDAAHAYPSDLNEKAVEFFNAVQEQQDTDRQEARK